MYDIEQLRAAILKRAVLDYILAIKKKNSYGMVYLERFFLSDWGQMLSYDLGEAIIAECKRVVNNKQKIPNIIEIVKLL